MFEKGFLGPIKVFFGYPKPRKNRKQAVTIGPASASPGVVLSSPSIVAPRRIDIPLDL